MCGDNPTFLINKKKINKHSNDLYVIAEIGTNYFEYGSIKDYINSAKESGCDAVKFQVYKPDTLVKEDHPNYNYFKDHSNYDFNFWSDIKEYCENIGIDLILTIFEEDLVDRLSLVVDGLKIASTDINNKRLIKKIALQGKPIILSTGASTFDEVFQAVNWCKEEGNSNIAILHCVCNYPTKDEDLNLGVIKDLNVNFLNIIGYSDHSLDISNIVNAHLIGANIIEKHFTLDKTLEGNDHFHSFDKNDMENFFREIEYNNKILGNYMRAPGRLEGNELLFGRRYLVVNNDIKQGQVITNEDIKIIKLSEREVLGNPDAAKADKIDIFVGKKALTDYKKYDIFMNRGYE